MQQVHQSFPVLGRRFGHLAVDGDPFNYIRNSVKITMNAYDGTMNFYVSDPSDPIIRAWEGVFPALFQRVPTLREAFELTLELGWRMNLELKAQPRTDEWTIERLDIRSKSAHLSSSGGWRRTAGGSITTLQSKLEVENLNGLLGQFGYGDYLKSGSGTLAFAPNAANTYAGGTNLNAGTTTTSPTG